MICNSPSRRFDLSRRTVSPLLFVLFVRVKHKMPERTADSSAAPTAAGASAGGAAARSSLFRRPFFIRTLSAPTMFLFSSSKSAPVPSVVDPAADTTPLDVAIALYLENAGVLKGSIDGAASPREASVPREPSIPRGILKAPVPSVVEDTSQLSADDQSRMFLGLPVSGSVRPGGRRRRLPPGLDVSLPAAEALRAPLGKPPPGKVSQRLLLPLSPVVPASPNSAASTSSFDFGAVRLADAGSRQRSERRSERHHPQRHGTDSSRRSSSRSSSQRGAGNKSLDRGLDALLGRRREPPAAYRHAATGGVPEPSSPSPRGGLGVGLGAHQQHLLGSGGPVEPAGLITSKPRSSVHWQPHGSEAQKVQVSRSQPKPPLPRQAKPPSDPPWPSLPIGMPLGTSI